MCTFQEEVSVLLSYTLILVRYVTHAPRISYRGEGGGMCDGQGLQIAPLTPRAHWAPVRTRTHSYPQPTQRRTFYPRELPNTYPVRCGIAVDAVWQKRPLCTVWGSRCAGGGGAPAGRGGTSFARSPMGSAAHVYTVWFNTVLTDQTMHRYNSVCMHRAAEQCRC
jgi:hypothetical protein